MLKLVCLPGRPSWARTVTTWSCGCCDREGGPTDSSSIVTLSTVLHGADAKVPRVTSLLSVSRVVCVIPPVVAAPPSLWVARPPSLYSHRMRVFRHRLREQTAPYAQQLQQVTALRSLRFPELRLVQFDSGTRGGPCTRSHTTPTAFGGEMLGAVPSQESWKL